MADSARRAKRARRNAGALVVCTIIASSAACSLFVDTGDMQDGSNDAALGSDVIAATDTSNVSDAAAPDSNAPTDAGPDANDAATAGPFTFVQKADFDPADGGSGDMTLSPVVPGNTIIVCVFLTGAANASVTDDVGDTFHVDVGPFTDANHDRVWIFSAINAIGNEKTIHVSVGSGGAIYTELYAMEYAGITAFDKGVGNYSSTGGSVSSGFVTTAVAGELLLGFAVDDSVVFGTGFVARDTANSDLVEDRIAGAPGPYAATATMTNMGTVLLAAYR